MRITLRKISILVTFGLLFCVSVLLFLYVAFSNEARTVLYKNLTELSNATLELKAEYAGNIELVVSDTEEQIYQKTIDLTQIQAQPDSLEFMDILKESLTNLLGHADLKIKSGNDSSGKYWEYHTKFNDATPIFREIEQFMLLGVQDLTLKDLPAENSSVVVGDLEIVLRIDQSTKLLRWVEVKLPSELLTTFNVSVKTGENEFKEFRVELKFINVSIKESIKNLTFPNEYVWDTNVVRNYIKFVLNR